MLYAEDWDEAGKIPDALWPRAGATGLLGLGYPEEFGGVSEGIDIWYVNIANEEFARVGVGGVSASLMVHAIGLPLVVNFASQHIKRQGAPRVSTVFKRDDSLTVCALQLQQ